MRPFVLLTILLVVLILLAVHKRLTTAEEVEKAAVKVEHHAVRDSHSPVGVVAVVALFVYVTWTVLGVNRGEAREEKRTQLESVESETGRTTRYT